MTNLKKKKDLQRNLQNSTKDQSNAKTDIVPSIRQQLDKLKIYGNSFLKHYHKGHTMQDN